MFPAHACLHILSPLCTLTYHVVSLSNSLLLVICIRITSSFLLLLRQTAIFTFSFLRTYFKLSYTTRFSICVMPHPHTYWFMHVIAHMQSPKCSSYSHISHQHTLRTSPHHCFCTKSKPTPGKIVFETHTVIYFPRIAYGSLLATFSSGVLFE
jgi:hypothetical protein